MGLKALKCYNSPQHIIPYTSHTTIPRTAHYSIPHHITQYHHNLPYHKIPYQTKPQSQNKTKQHNII